MRCSSFSESILDAEGTEYKTWGILVETEHQRYQIRDITFKKEEIEELCRRLQSMTVADCHILDVVEDFITEISSI